MSFDDTDPSGPCAGADLCCVCTPKLGCLYCLLGSHPSRSVSLCLDIKGKNWRTGSKLESLPRQGSYIILLLLEIFYTTYLQTDLWETRAATSTCFNTGQNHTPKLKTHRERGGGSSVFHGWSPREVSLHGFSTCPQWQMEWDSDPSRVLLVLKSLLSQQLLTYLCSHVCPVNSRRLPAFLVAPHLTSTLYVSRFEYVTARVDKQVGIVPNSVTKDASCRSSPLTLPVHFHNNVPSTFTSPHSPHSGSVELARELANLSQLREAKLSKDTWLSKWQYRDEHLHCVASGFCAGALSYSPSPLW